MRINNTRLRKKIKKFPKLNSFINILINSDDPLFPSPIEAQFAIGCLTEALLGQDYYIVLPCSNEQGNTEILDAILRNYSKDYRKLIKKKQKELRSLEKKPNQIVDEIRGVVYPPKEAIVDQLATIRAIIPPTIKIYESTEDIHTIQPNLDMIQRAICYLRGAPLPDDMRPAPEEKIKPEYIPATPGFFIVSQFNKKSEYDVSMDAFDIDPVIMHPELFGDNLDFKAVEMIIKIPVTCGKNYLVAQENPILVHYIEDEYVFEIEPGVFVKEKQYYMKEDYFEYAFLISPERSKIRIAFYADYEEPIVFNITTHIHFKKEDILEEGGGEENGTESKG